MATTGPARFDACMQVVFVLLPPGSPPDQWLASAPGEAQAALAARHLHQRNYPAADDGPHLLSLLRAGRDPLATRWGRGMVLAAVVGAGLGGIVHGVLSAGFDMLGGLVEIAVPLGLGLGAFLGVFSAAMAGTETARDELRPLAAAVVKGAVLVQVAGRHLPGLRALREHAIAQGLPVAWR